MKTIKLTLGLAALALIAGCQDSRVADLEKRVATLEADIAALRNKNNVEQATREQERLDFRACVAEANSLYNADLVNNGSKLKNGGYRIDAATEKVIRQRRIDRIEECKMLHRQGS